ncbi:Sensor protein FixL [Seminavis robusta]|uniref:Sensor protein FixL n=1 Tax=Seminavis robusta TaxID=568900 RepID=A0A9N8D7P2_9STRA|nr:Sensor protein FixL [Seminavis robusta]|eukprot:Sro28_g018720.1 Sensor protein FixL (432) ;mRNA; r:77513-78808
MMLLGNEKLVQEARKLVSAYGLEAVEVCLHNIRNDKELGREKGLSDETNAIEDPEVVPASPAPTPAPPKSDDISLASVLATATSINKDLDKALQLVHDRNKKASATVGFQMNSSDDRKVMAAIIDASFDSLFAIDLNGCIQFANQTAAQVFGYEKEELIGSNISCTVGGGHAASHDGYLQKYKETGVTNLMGSMREVQARRKDGTEFPVKLGIKRVYRQNNDLLVAFIRDITEQKKAEALQSKVQEDQKVRAAILDASFDAMFAINLEGKIELVNLAAIKQFGYDSQEGLVGNNIDMIVGGGHARSHNQYLKKYKDTGVERLMGTLREVKGKRKDGSEFPCIIGIKRVDRNGSSDNPLMVAFIRDITKQKEADALQLRVQEDQKVRAAILDASFDAMFAIDLEGKIELVNLAAIKHLDMIAKKTLLATTLT